MGVFVQVNEGSRQARGKPLGYIIQENGCWEWVGAVNRDGYGHTKLGGRTQTAHVYVYKMTGRTIPDGMQLDHLCKNRACCNPDHLEPVTSQENTLRGDGPTARNAAKTHCKHGHPFNEANTRIERYRGRSFRQCRACHSAKGRAAYAAKTKGIK